MAETIIGKITMRAIKVSPAKHATEKGTAIARIFGMAAGTKEVVDKVRGDVYNSIVGDFGAVNLESGEEFRSGVLYLPTSMHNMLQSALAKLEDGSGTVNFALEVRAVKATNPAGYAYEAVSLLPTALTDPLEEMKKQIAAKTAPALNAGKK
jgi:hypothetical protein